MLFQPTNISPSTFGPVGNGVADATKPLAISWQVNGNSALASFSIAVYKNDANSTKLYDTGTLTDGCPFYGVDYSGNVVMFSHTIAADVLAANGIVNGGSYKFIITQNGEESGVAFSVVQTSAAVFEAKSAPTLSIDTVPEPIPYRSYTFSASYDQAQGDALTWFRWIITGNTGTLLDTGNIYGSRDVRVKYDGFFSGSYTIRCIVETVSGVQAEAETAFSVQYTVSSMTGYLKAEPSCDRVALNWQKIQYIPGTAKGDYSIKDGICTLPAGTQLTWDTSNGETLDIPAGWTAAWAGTMEQGTPFTLRDAGGHTIAFVIGSDSVQLTYDAAVLFSHAYTPSIVVNEWVVFVSPESINISLRQPYAGLYPSASLYPGTALYPKAFVLNEYVFQGTITGLAQGNVNLIAVNGKQECNYVWVTNGTVSADVIRSLTDGTEKRPDWTQDTQFLVSFEDGLNAGNLYSANEAVTGVSIYRREEGEETLEFLSTFPVSEVEAVDFSTRNGRTYTYYLFPASERLFLSSPMISDAATPCGWDWVLLECEERSGGGYTAVAEYRFGKNLSSGSITNNNAPSILENFTAYPTVQIKSVNYLSGTLQSLIGVIRNGVYSDTVAGKDAIYALSVSNRPMFLKSRKGDLWQVKIGGAVAMETMDAAREQAQTVSLPWVQVGSGEGVSIVCAGEDGSWDSLKLG